MSESPVSGSLYMGVDIGTTAIKGIVIRANGEVASERTINRNPSFHSQPYFEHDPEEVWWPEFIFIVNRMLNDLGSDKELIKSLAITGMVPNIYPTRTSGAALHNAVLYYDPRISPISSTTRAKYNSKNTIFLSKLLWLKSHLSDDWSRVQKIFTTHNYINFRLTNHYAIDTVTAEACGCIFDPELIRWDDNLLQENGIDPTILPPIYPPAKIIGEVTHAASQTTGLKEGIPVCVGSSDTICSILGCGAQEAGDIMLYYGTYGCAARLLTTASNIVTGKDSKHPTFKWIASIPRSGFQHAMLTELFAPPSIRSVVGVEFSAIDRLANRSIPGANGITVVQVLDLPKSNVITEPSAAIFNLKTHNSLSDLHRAILEAFGYGLRLNFEMSGELPLPLKGFAAGGGARNHSWRQIVTDILGCDQFFTPRSLGALGAALIALAAIDEASFNKVIADLRSETEPSLVNHSHEQAYLSAYERYKMYITVYNHEATHLYP